MNSQKAVSLLEFLVILLILVIAAAIAMPLLLRSDNSDTEGKATAVLRQIHTAEQEYYGAGRFYGPFSKLSLPFTATDQGFTANGYTFYLTLNGANRRWCAIATPETVSSAVSGGVASQKPGRTFGIDETGQILRDINPTACQSGVLDKSKGDIVR